MISEQDARRLVFLQTLADRDTRGLLLTDALIEAAGRDAGSGDETGNRTAHLTGLSRALAERLKTRHSIHVDMFASNRHTLLFTNLIILSLLTGLFSNYLGGNTVNVLWNPLMGLLIWNLCIYAVLAIRMLLRVQMHGRLTWLQSLLFRIKQLVSGHHRGSGPEDINQLLSGSALLFLKRWAAFFPRLTVNRLAMVSHGLAMAITVGAIAGMYARGLGQAFRFTWASTFLNDPQPVLSVLFAPALWTGLFPGGLAAFDGSQDAMWIHLFAVTAALYIVLPRLILLGWARSRARRALEHLEPPPSHSLDQRLFLAAGGRSRPVFLLAYGVTPDSLALNRLRDQVRSDWGLLFDPENIVEIAWGEVEFPWPDSPKPPAWVLLFNGAQTPEAEVHGAFLHEFFDQLRHHDKDPLLRIVVDTQKLDSERRESRRPVWQHVLQSADAFDWVNLAENAEVQA